ncbi:MAG: amidohydrolase family protein [Acidimicrobiia bacterium]|nr:amidohydrolase family protein [Acidimicrobiia bacterium]
MEDLLGAWARSASALLPPSVRVWDAHTHTGATDPDGRTLTAVELLEGLATAGHEAAVVCSSADPDGYEAANGRVLAEATASDGRLVPFLRVDPNRADAADAARRWLDAGHRGVKLHPRSDGFGFGDPGVHAVLDVAAERRVPVLVHAGRAMPPLGRVILDHLDARPGLTIVLAHAAISDLGWVAAASAGRSGLVFDTAWWNPADHAALFSWVDASQILYASDAPYGWPTMSATITTRSAVQAGLAGHALEAVFGGNLRRILEGRDRSPLGRGVAFRPPLELRRVASNLHAAIGAIFGGGDPAQGVELARRACETEDTPFDALLGAVGRLLDDASATDGLDRLRALVVALAVAVTPAAGFVGDRTTR